jgi:hypothetical protein
MIRAIRGKTVFKQKRLGGSQASEAFGVYD